MLPIIFKSQVANCQYMRKDHVHSSFVLMYRFKRLPTPNLQIRPYHFKTKSASSHKWPSLIHAALVNCDALITLALRKVTPPGSLFMTKQSMLLSIMGELRAFDRFTTVHFPGSKVEHAQILKSTVFQQWNLVRAFCKWAKLVFSLVNAHPCKLNSLGQ